jgi:hypothetical protein
LGASLTANVIAGYLAPPASGSLLEHEAPEQLHPGPEMEAKVIPEGKAAFNITSPSVMPAFSPLVTVIE